MQRYVSCQRRILRRASSRRIAFAACFLVSVAAGASAAQGSRASPVGPIDFDIPAQPLGKALVAFGATAGLDLYYNAALAEGRRSATVMGKLTPIVALQRLLEGTGLVPETTAPYSVILVPAPRKPVVPSGSVVATPGGILTLAGGSINAFTDGSILVNQLRGQRQETGKTSPIIQVGWGTRIRT